MNWIESPKTRDHYWNLKDESGKFTIIQLPNSFELSYDFRFEDVTVRTTHLSWSLAALKSLAEIISTDAIVIHHNSIC